MFVCNTFLQLTLINLFSSCLYATLFYILHLQPSFLWIQHFSSFSICQNSPDLFVCNTFLQYKLIKLFSTCLYATLFYILYLQPAFFWMLRFSSFKYLLKFSKFVCLQHFSQLYTYKTFLYLLICYIYMQHFFNFCNFTTSLNLFICKTVPLSLFVKILWICLCATLFSNLHL